MSYFKETPCGHCKKPIRYSDSQLGTTVRCPKCGNSVTLGLPAVPGAQNPQANTDKSNRPVGAPVSAKGKPGWVKDVKDLAGVVPPTPTGRTEVFETAKPVGKVSNDAWADRNATGVPPLPSSPPPGNYTLVRRVAMGLSAAAMIGLLATGTWWFRTSAAGTGQMQTQSGPAKTVGGDAQQPPAGGAQPQAPTTPQTPPPSTPSTPPGQPEPPPTPPQDQNALDPKRPHAEQVHVVTDFESVLFASSIIGMRDFDKRYFESLPLQDSYQKCWSELMEQGPEAGPDTLIEIVCLSQFIEHHKRIWEQRPALALALPLDTLPNGVQLGVYAEVPDELGKRLTGISGSALVSKSDAVPIREDVPPELKAAVDFNKDKNRYEVNLTLPWNHEELRRLKQEASFEIVLKVVYSDKSSDTLKERVTVKPARELEFYPGQAAYGTLIDKDHPWVKKVINQLNQSATAKQHSIKMDQNGHGMAAALPAIYLLWKDLKSRGLTYQSMTEGEGSLDADNEFHLSQRMRPIHEAMSDQNANCADGSILFASFFEAMELEPLLVFVPGHVFVAVKFKVPVSETQRDEKVNLVVPLETTLIGNKTSQCPELEVAKDDPAKNTKIALKRMVSDFPFVQKDPAFWNFAEALIRAEYEYAEAWGKAEIFMKSWGDKINAAKAAGKALDSEAELESAPAFWTMPVQQLRLFGVRAVGAPSDLDREFTLPSSKK